MDVPTALRCVSLFSTLTLACFTNSNRPFGTAQEVKTDTAQPNQTSLVAE